MSSPAASDDGPDLSLLAAALDGLDLGCVFVIGADRRVVYSNDLARRRFGEDGDDWLRRAQLHDPDTKATLTGAEATPLALLEAAEVPTSTLGWIDGDGAERLLEARMRPLRPGTHLLTIRDVSDIWAMRAALARTGPSTGAPTLRESAHDLGNVLGIIQMAGEGLAGPGLTAEAQRKRGDILDATRRGSAILDRLAGRDLTDARNGTTTNVTELLKSVAALVRRVMPAEIDFAVDLPDAPINCQCERGPLEAVVVQLLGRARRSLVAASGGALRLSLVSGAPHLRIEIAQDRGRPADGGRDPYAGERKARTEGTDAITAAEGLARSAKGRFHISETGHGGEHLVLELPQVGGGIADDVMDGPGLEGYRVLLAESDGSLRGLLSDALRRAGATVAVAEDGEAVLHIIAEGACPDVLICNPRLRDGMTSQQLLTEADGLGGGVRLIELTAVLGYGPEDEPAPRTVRLQKPVTLPVLANAIRLRPPRG